MQIRIQDPKNVHTDLDPRGVNCKDYKRILTFFLPVLYSFNEAEHFLDLYGFTSWIRIQEAFFMRIRIRNTVLNLYDFIYIKKRF